MRVSSSSVSASTGAGRRTERDPVELLRELYPRLVALGAILVPVDDIEDVVHDCLVETLLRHPGFTGITYPLAYTKRVLVRRITRTRARLREIPDGLAGRLDHPSAGFEAASDDMLSVLQRLRELPPRQRACMYLRVVEDLSDRDISEVLGCRMSTVRSQLSRAAATLRIRPCQFREEGSTNEA